MATLSHHFTFHIYERAACRESAHGTNRIRELQSSHG